MTTDYRGRRRTLVTYNIILAVKMTLVQSLNLRPASSFRPFYNENFLEEFRPTPASKPDYGSLMRRDTNEVLGEENMFNVCTITPHQSGKGAVPLPHNVGLQYSGHWSVWRGCKVSDTKGANATFAFQGTINTPPSYTSKPTRMITGISLEVYGTQMVEKAHANEGST